ncbi:MAG: DUF3244 domain-containing protein [Bacteroidales bacterium]|nr:DUF3244 domain-containing protein [Bacteroidales bacterium]
MVRKTTLIILAVLLGTAVLAKPTNSDVTAEPVRIMSIISNDSNNKSSEPISASIDGHALTIYINENVGIAHIVVTNSNGVYIDRDNILHTPDMATLLIEDEGFYTVTITLNNGDVYYGDFMVTE